MRDRLFRFVAPAAALIALLAAPARATVYDIVDLGSLGGARGSGAYDLSDHGVAVGYSFVPGATDLVHAMLNDHGTVLDLGTLGGTQSLARAVNAAGTVVGWAYPVGLSWQRAFVWQGGTMTPVGTFGGVASDAFDLNDDGMVVGSAFNDVGQERGFWWKDGVLHDVGTIGGGQSRVIAVNESGDYVGMSATEGDDEFHAFLGKPGSPLYDLGTLGGPASHANDVNELVHACGWSMIQSNNPASRGFLWSDGVMKSLGTLGGIYSAAYGLNDLDQVVGASTRADEVQVAFLWANDQMVDLNTLLSPGAPGAAGSGWLLTGAYGIDVHGAIVGEGVRPDGAARAFLLVPQGTTDAPPPGAPGKVTRFAGAMPNPVRDGARFDFSLARPGRASLELLDLAGRRVRTVSRGTFDAGPGSVAWDGRGDDGARLAPGIYHAVFTSERGLITRRFAVVR